MIGCGRQLFVRRRAAASAAPGFRTAAAAASSVATAGLLTATATFGLLTSAAAETCAAAVGLLVAAAALGLLNAATVFDLHASEEAIFIAEAAFGLSVVGIDTPGLPAVLTVPGLFSNLLVTRRSINRIVAVSRASIRMWVAIIAAVGQL